MYQNPPPGLAPAWKRGLEQTFHRLDQLGPVVQSPISAYPGLTP